MDKRFDSADFIELVKTDNRIALEAFYNRQKNTFVNWANTHFDLDADTVLDFFGNRDTPRHQAMKNSIRDFSTLNTNLHKMKLRSEPFNKIASGLKDIELRLFDEKRQEIQVGDTIEFTNIKTQERLYRSVIQLIRKQKFSEIFNEELSVERTGFSKEEDIDMLMSNYYPTDRISEHGVVGIVLRS